jgi:hypothetical protein
MSKALFVLGILGAMSSPAMAQTVPANPQSGTAATPKPQTIKKKVCQRIDDEETTGSRLGSAPVICKIVEVPQPKGGQGSGQLAPAER